MRAIAPAIFPIRRFVSCLTLASIARAGFRLAAILLVNILNYSAFGGGTPVCAADLPPRGFESPEKAVSAFVAAIRDDNTAGMLAILGTKGKKLIFSGDEVADKNGRDKFLTAYDQHNVLSHTSADTVVLRVGSDGWPLPIPIMKKHSTWVFDARKAEKEILKRRVGRNELHVIEFLDAYVDAQQEYASKDCSGNGTVEFAQRLFSTPGTHDGLYWEDEAGNRPSPLGPLVAQAATEGYGKEDNLEPFHGYYFKILKGQGKHADGGTYNYIVKDKMILGFAMVAYPAEFGNSGVMTFLVNQQGTIYEKNLGKSTRRIAEAMKVFDPGKSWTKVPVKNSEASAPGGMK